MNWEDYYITNDNILYQYIETYPNGELMRENKFIMSDVKEIKDDIILKTNGEVYAKSEEGTNKIFTNVSTLKNNFIKCSPNASLSSKYFAILDTNGNLYTIDDYKKGSSNAKLIATNIKSIFTSQISNFSMGLYAIDNNNDLLSCSYDNSYKINIGDNKVSDSINGLSYLKTLDGYLLINRMITTKSNWSVEINAMEKITSIGKIKDVFIIHDKRVFVNEDGDTWTDKVLREFYQIPLSSKSINLKINNKDVVLENRMQIIDGRTMYPFRECLDIIGASVQWDGEKQVAIGEVPGIKIEFPIEKNNYYINGVKHTMDATTYVDNTIGRTYIPIRYAAEGLGYTVDWIEGDFENTISIYK